MSLGMRVKTLRLAKGLTQQKLADMINVSRIYVQAIESNRRKPSMDLLERLAEALDATPADLMRAPSDGGGRMQLEEVLSSGEVEVWYRSRKLSPKDMKRIHRLVETVLEEWDEEEEGDRV
ncbi:MAG: helix-turn-helix domain-containing protein [Thermanaerothrix sp.]|nr:helix-turn-helix domain-containing protein [Thermanaerothrix sp.]